MDSADAIMVRAARHGLLSFDALLSAEIDLAAGGIKGCRRLAHWNRLTTQRKIRAFRLMTRLLFRKRGF
jgi:hypothetical protein